MVAVDSAARAPRASRPVPGSMSSSQQLPFGRLELGLGQVAGSMEPREHLSTAATGPVAVAGSAGATRRVDANRSCRWRL